MIIEKEIMPWLVASGEEDRKSISGVYYDHAKHELQVTNGKALAVFPVTEDDADESGIIPCEAFDAAFKAARAKGSMMPPTLAVKDGKATACFAPGAPSFPLIQGNFPNVEQVIPDFKKSRVRTAKIRINPAILHNLWRACVGKESRGATLEFQINENGESTRGAVLVSGSPYARAAVFMPMRWPGKQ